MTRLYLLLILSMSLLKCEGQKPNQKLIASKNKCEGNWQYFSVMDTVYGEILFHAKADAICGAIVTASLTIVKTISGDSIRVLEICNVDKKFEKHTKVKVAFSQKPAFGAMLPIDNYFDCIINKTCYGFIIRNDNQE